MPTAGFVGGSGGGFRAAGFRRTRGRYPGQQNQDGAQPRQLFSRPTGNPNTPTGYDATDSTKLFYGNRPQPEPAPAGSTTGLTPALRTAPRQVTGQAVNGMVPGGKVSTYAPRTDSPDSARQIVGINLDQPTGYDANDSTKLAYGNKPLAAPPPQQTEAVNPLSGDAANQPTGKTTTLPTAPPTAPTQDLPEVNHGKALGFSSRGNATPAGQDVPASGAAADQPGAPAAPSYTGGTGAYQRSFSNPTSASIYHSYVKGLFGKPDEDEEQPA